MWLNGSDKSVVVSLELVFNLCLMIFTHNLILGDDKNNGEDTRDEKETNLI